jgi:methylated-DNA-[protein]-cysteine S-methyltransferase
LGITQVTRPARDVRATFGRTIMHAPVTNPERLFLDTIASPLGLISLVTDEHGVLRLLSFADGRENIGTMLRRQYANVTPQPGEASAALRDHLAAYFAGDLDALGRIPWATAGTSFQRSVWTALAEIPAGTTMTYGAFAARIGAPRAVRAVGHANGANPISVVVPCHRLVGANGTLTGYGGGLHRKQWLLEHEGVRL